MSDLTGKQYISVFDRGPDGEDTDLITITLENGAQVKDFATAKELALEVLGKVGLTPDATTRVKLVREEEE